MPKKIPVLYIYNSIDESFSSFFDSPGSSVLLERVVHSENTSNEKMHFYACVPTKKLRIEIAEKPDTVLKTHDDKYTVWRYVGDESMARKHIAVFMMQSVVLAKQKLISEIALEDVKYRKAATLIGEQDD